MKILHVTHQYWPALGGSEKYITDISESLVQSGHQVDVFTSRSKDTRSWRNELPYEEIRKGVKIHRFDSLERGPLTWRALHYGLANYWRTRRSNRYMLDIIWGNGPVSFTMMCALFSQAKRYDIIHSNTLHYAPVSYSYWIAKKMGIPYAVTPFFHIDQPYVFDIPFQINILRGADLVIAVTEMERDYLIAKGVSPERIATTGVGLPIDNYVDQPVVDVRAKLNISPNAFVLLFLARKEPYKGLEKVLSSLEKIQPEMPDIVLVSAGSETDDSVKLKEKYGHLKNVVHYDYVDDSLKLDLLNACDVLVLPSEGESFGIVYAEAWAFKKPVIGASSGAIPSLISHGEDGLLVNPKQVDDLVTAIRKLYSNRNMREQLGLAGYRKLVTRYTLDKIASAVSAAYHRAVRQWRTRNVHNN